VASEARGRTFLLLFRSSEGHTETSLKGDVTGGRRKLHTKKLNKT